MKEKILVFDDEPLILKSIKKAHSRVGYYVTHELPFIRKSFQINELRELVKEILNG